MESSGCDEQMFWRGITSPTRQEERLKSVKVEACWLAAALVTTAMKTCLALALLAAIVTALPASGGAYRSAPWGEPRSRPPQSPLVAFPPISPPPRRPPPTQTSPSSSPRHTAHLGTFSRCRCPTSVLGLIERTKNYKRSDRRLRSRVRGSRVDFPPTASS